MQQVWTRWQLDGLCNSTGESFVVVACGKLTASKWPRKSPCARFYAAGRLHAISVEIGSGNRGILCYRLYGVSGARWSSEQRKKTHNMIQAVLSDGCSWSRYSDLWRLEF